ncbi:MAG: hypothetical protein ACRDST_18770 [Pseudonocardiaceae bacterium]
MCGEPELAGVALEALLRRGEAAQGNDSHANDFHEDDVGGPARPS